VSDHLLLRQWSAASLLLLLAMAACSTGPQEADSSTGSTRSASDPATPSTEASQGVGDRSLGCDVTASAHGPHGTHVQHAVSSGEKERSYALYVPASYDGSATPLVVDLHGYLSGGQIQAQMSDLGTLADSAGFIVATPQGNGDMPYWNATPESSLPDDVQFVSDVIHEVSSAACIDPARVYVDGFSNGAFMASLIACRLSDQVAAVAAVSGLLYPADCAPSRPVPILAFHGTADEFVSAGGGPNAALDTLTWNADSRAAFAHLPFDDVTVAQREWSHQQGCDSTPDRQRTSPEIELIEYSGCDAGSTVQLYLVDGGGHTWPGSSLSEASESLLGRTTNELDASATIWEFFREHPMPR